MMFQVLFYIYGFPVDVPISMSIPREELHELFFK